MRDPSVRIVPKSGLEKGFPSYIKKNIINKYHRKLKCLQFAKMSVP
jgi:hypothetical protein